MADFLQPNQQQDPEALRKALLAKLFGGPPQPGVPGTAAAPTTPTVAPTSPAAQPLSTPPGPQPAKPISAAPTPTATDPGNQPTPIMSETDWAKQNPQPAHTPYTPPDLKHRLLTGLFAGMQEFGRPGEGARTVANYGADIERKTEEEKNYPTTSADATRKRYMDYVAGQRAPIDLQDLQSQIAERQAHARDLDAQAKLRANPVQKPENLQQMHADALADALKRGVKPSEDPHVLAVEDAIQRVQKEPAEKNLEKITVVGPDGKPHLYGVNAKGETVKDFGVAPQAQKESRNDKTADVVERETRQNIRKAQQSYRDVEEKTSNMDNFITEAKGGNKAAVKIVPLEGALEITTSQGTKRINRTEIEQYASAGSLFDKIKGKIGGVLTGKDIPDEVLSDMASLSQVLKKNGWEKYNSEYDDEAGIANGYGVDISKHLPRIQQHGAASGGGGAAQSGAGAQPLPSFKDWKAKQKP